MHVIIFGSFILTGRRVSNASISSDMPKQNPDTSSTSLLDEDESQDINLHYDTSLTLFDLGKWLN